MTNNSGKFESVLYSHKSLDEQNSGGGDNDEGLKNTPQNDGGSTNDTADKLAGLIPDIPQDTMSKVKYYLGEWWWLWLIAIVLYFANKK